MTSLVTESGSGSPEVDSPVTEEELTALALSTPYDETLTSDATPLTLTRMSGLPTSYLPGAMPGPRRRWMRPVAIAIVCMLLFITLLGFCGTYGQIQFA